MDNELNNTNKPEAAPVEAESKTYTQEEVDKLLQAETDRRVTSALKKQELKNQEKVREAEKLSTMNAEQRYMHELEQREKAIAEKEAALALSENKNAAAKILAEKGISLQLVDFVVAEDAETMNDRIKLLEKEFKKSVKDEVEKRLGSNAPKITAQNVESLTKEQFKNLGVSELMSLKRENPELWAEFSKELVG